MPKLTRYEWMAIAILLLFVLWIIFQASGQLMLLVDSVGVVLPNWLLVANLGMVLVFAVLATMPLNLAPSLRVLSAALFLVCGSLLGPVWDRYPVATAVVGALLYAEVFWIVPKWAEKHKGKDLAP